MIKKVPNGFRDDEFRPKWTEFVHGAEKDYLDAWHIMDEAVPVVSFDDRTRAAIWLPDRNIQIDSMIRQVPVLAVSLTDANRRIDEQNHIWYAGMVPIGLLHGEQKIIEELAEPAMDQAQFGAYALRQCVEHISADLPVHYVRN